MSQKKRITGKEYSEFTCHQLIGKTNLIQVCSSFDRRSKSRKALSEKERDRRNCLKAESTWQPGQPRDFQPCSHLPRPLGRNTALCKCENVVFGIKVYRFWNREDVGSSGRALVSNVTMCKLLGCLVFSFII